MKRITVLLLAVLVLVPMAGFAAPLDLAGATKEELLEWRQQIDDALLLNGWFPFTVIDSKTSGEQVLRLQERLSKLYYYTKEPTGKYDSNTSKAFAAFMKAQGLKAGKTVTIENQELLFSSNAIPKTTPLPPPTPTPPPAPFFSQPQDDLGGSFAGFIKSFPKSSKYKVSKLPGASNEFFTVEKWKVGKNDIYTNEIYAYRENASGKTIAVVFYRNYMTVADGGSIFKEAIASFMQELDCNAVYDRDSKYNPFIFLELDPARYNGRDTNMRIYQSNKTQSFEFLQVVFMETARMDDSDNPRAAFIIGFDDFIRDLPFTSIKPLPTAAPTPVPTPTPIPTPSPTPTLPPTPTPFNPSTVSRLEFLHVQIGTSYDRVVDIFGGHGTKEWSSKSASGTSAQYSWRSEWGSSIVITFHDNRVSTIAEY